MSESNGTVRYDVFADVTVQDGGKELWFKFSSGCSQIDDLSPVMVDIQTRIESGKKPAQTLTKQLGRIALHVAQLQDALTELFTCYGRMTGPHTRMSGSTKARMALLSSMPVKMLKDYAGIYIPDEVGTYILPDDKTDLIMRLCQVLADDKAEIDAESVSVQ